MNASLVDRVMVECEAGGSLSKVLSGRYRPREGQLQMAQAVAQTLEQGGILAVEAGTGVGKTFAYLMPALLSGRRVVISTATKTLQDQLFLRDIPVLLAALQVSPKVAVLKGRSSYLCVERLSRARGAAHHLSNAELVLLGAVERWSLGTRQGDLGELPQIEERSALWPLITSTRDNCLGGGCPSAQACHVNTARRRAELADVVVINHHLFFSDLSLRQVAPADLLPEAPIWIFDEAHRLNDIGVAFLGDQVSAGAWAGWGRDVVDVGLKWARGYQPWPQLAYDLEVCWRHWAGHLSAGSSPGGRRRWSTDDMEGKALSALEGLRSAGERIVISLNAVADVAPELRRLAERGRTLLAQLRRLLQPPPEGWVRWLETGGTGQIRWLEVPLGIAEAMQSEWAAREGTRAAWVFTSATLGMSPDLDWFLDQVGLRTVARALVVPSPFDYEQQAAWWVPPGVPDPEHPHHVEWLARWLAKPVQRLGGRTLALMTSLQGMHRMAVALRQQLSGTGVAVLCQGDAARLTLLNMFREGRQPDGRPGPCVLVATGAFWEGVDVPGDALQLLLIDRLPFSSPDDPLLQALAERSQKQGQNPFEANTLPQAAMALRQGIGRLIRSSSDRGLFVLGDNRIMKRSYGRRLLGVMPPMRLLGSETEFESALAQLTKASTKDQPTSP